MNNPFSEKMQNSGPVFTMGSMTLVLGMLIGLAWVTNRDKNERLERLPQDVRARLQGADFTAIQESQNELQQQIKELRKKITNYEETLAKQSGEANALNDSLQDLKVIAGLVEMKGPGIVVTLIDSRRQDLPPDAGIIHDYDLLRIVNELWNAGAEAIAIGNQRIIAGTSIRCVGSVVRINDVPMAAPIRIYAIGNAETLQGALFLPGGVADEFRDTDPNMMSVEQLKETKVPAYNGAIKRTLSTVADEAGKKEGSKKP